MATVNIRDAKTHLSRLVAAAARGEEVVIAKAGRPMVRMVPVASPSGAPRPKRQLGGLADRGGWVSDDFDAPLPDEVLAAFEGRDKPGPG